jgi:hypothetical protein
MYHFVRQQSNVYRVAATFVVVRQVSTGGVDADKGAALCMIFLPFSPTGGDSSGARCLQYLVDKMSSVLDSRANSSPEVAAAGMVVNTMGYIDGLGYELLLYSIKSLRVSQQYGEEVALRCTGCCPCCPETFFARSVLHFNRQFAAAAAAVPMPGAGAGGSAMAAQCSRQWQLVMNPCEPCTVHHGSLEKLLLVAACRLMWCWCWSKTGCTTS